VRLAPLLVPVPRRRFGVQRMDQAMGGRGNLIHRAIERLFVLLRRPRCPAQLAHELERRRPDLVIRRGRLEVRERLDVATHARPSRRFENPSYDVIIEPDKTSGKWRDSQ
jgi:hypothetical protein